MNRTKNLNTELFIRDPGRPEMTPLPILLDKSGRPAAKMIEALGDDGGEIAVRAVGPDAAKAAEVLRNLFDGPSPSVWEALSEQRAWNKRIRARRAREASP